MPEPQGSLLVQAQRLSAVARAKRQNESDSQTEGQVATALNKLKAQLLGLSTALRSYEAAKAVQFAIAPPPDLKAPVVTLKSQVDGIGRPSPQFLTKRALDLGRNVTDLQSAVDAAWARWTSEQIGALGEDGLSGHSPRLAVIQEQILGLRARAKQKFTSADYQIFRLGLSRVHDLIEELQAPTDLERVVERIKQGTVTLADLTESELIGLRADPTICRTISLSLV